METCCIINVVWSGYLAEIDFFWVNVGDSAWKRRWLGCGERNCSIYSGSHGQGSEKGGRVIECEAMKENEKTKDETWKEKEGRKWFSGLQSEWMRIGGQNAEALGGHDWTFFKILLKIIPWTIIVIHILPNRYSLSPIYFDFWLLIFFRLFYFSSHVFISFNSYSNYFNITKSKFLISQSNCKNAIFNL